MASSITLTAPVSAAQGEVVSVAVTVTNISAYHYSFKTEIYKVPDLYPDEKIFDNGPTGEIITSGSARTYGASFVMPDCNVTVLVWVERWNFDHWEYDNAVSKVVLLYVPVPQPEFSGLTLVSITKL